MVTIAIGHSFSHSHQNIETASSNIVFMALSYVCHQRNAQTLSLETAISQSSVHQDKTI